MKVTQKWLKNDSGRPTPKSPKADSKVTPDPIFKSFLSHLRSLWGGTWGVSFESFLGHFKSFCVSVQKRHCDWFMWSRGFPQGRVLHSGPLRSKKTTFSVCFAKPTKVFTFYPLPSGVPCLLVLKCSGSKQGDPAKSLVGLGSTMRVQIKQLALYHVRR